MADREPVSDAAKVIAETRAASVGERLRTARAARSLSLEQLANELRIEARQLAALERNDFAQIGVPVFVRGYLKQYGTRLGLDPAELIAAYQAQDEAQDVEIQPSRTIKMRDERQITFWVVALVVLAVLVALLAYWWINEPVTSLSSRGPAVFAAAVELGPPGLQARQARQARGGAVAQAMAAASNAAPARQARQARSGATNLAVAGH